MELLKEEMMYNRIKRRKSLFFYFKSSCEFYIFGIKYNKKKEKRGIQMMKKNERLDAVRESYTLTE